MQRRALQNVTSSSDYKMQCVVLDVEPILMRLDRLNRTFSAVYKTPAAVYIDYCHHPVHMTSLTNSMLIVRLLIHFLFLMVE